MRWCHLGTHLTYYRIIIGRCTERRPKPKVLSPRIRNYTGDPKTLESSACEKQTPIPSSGLWSRTRSSPPAEAQPPLAPSRVEVACDLGFLVGLRSFQGPLRVSTHRPQSSSFLGFIYRILYGNPQKELLWGLWVVYRAAGTTVC